MGAGKKAGANGNVLVRGYRMVWLAAMVASTPVPSFTGRIAPHELSPRLHREARVVLDFFFSRIPSTIKNEIFSCQAAV
ncbi:hypothetical protein [Paraburkholderia sp. J8-2]|uniref:hypothetical protein n=1 Tax=Paraburkholderia sp. J8-2 TaxID=2805440 RepID=UPI002AB67444|nr:hypothetical protein [Paraburkholderia sp. J8-2]